MSEDFTPGRSRSPGPGPVRIVASNAGQFTGPGTNTCLVGEAERAVVDPGPDAAHSLLAHVGKLEREDRAVRADGFWSVAG